MIGIVHGVNNIFNLYFFLIILRIFLTWIPNVQWENQPWKTIREITDIYLNLFRRIIPPFNGLDFSPIKFILYYRGECRGSACGAHCAAKKQNRRSIL